MGTLNSAWERTVGSLDRTYLVRGWLIGAVFSGFLLSAAGAYPFSVVLAVVNALLMPFSKFVWDSSKEFLLGDNAFFTWGVLMLIGLILKVIVNAVLWAFAVLIAPLGILFLALRR